MQDQETDPFRPLAAGSAILHFVIQKVLDRNEFSVMYQAFDGNQGQYCWLEEYFPISLAKRQDDALLAAPLQKNNFQQGLDFFIEESQVYQKISAPSLLKLQQYFSAQGTVFRVFNEEKITDNLSERMENSRWDLFKEQPRILQNFLPAIQALHKAGLSTFVMDAEAFAFNDKNLPVFLGLAQARQRLAHLLNQEEIIEDADNFLLSKITISKTAPSLGKKKEQLFLQVPSTYQLDNFFALGQSGKLEKYWATGLIIAIKHARTRLYPVAEQLFAPFLQVKKTASAKPWLAIGLGLALAVLGISLAGVLFQQKPVDTEQVAEKVAENLAVDITVNGDTLSPMQTWQNQLADNSLPFTLIRWQEFLDRLATTKDLNSDEINTLQQAATIKFFDYIQSLIYDKRFQDFALLTPEIVKTLEKWQLPSETWLALQKTAETQQQALAIAQEQQNIQRQLQENAELLAKNSLSSQEEQKISESLQQVQKLAAAAAFQTTIVEQTTTLLMPYLVQGEAALANKDFRRAKNLLDRVQAFDPNKLVSAVQSFEEKYVRLRREVQQQEAEQREAEARRQTQRQAEREQAEREAEARRQAQLQAEREQAEREAEARRQAQLQAEREQAEREAEARRQAQLQAEREQAEREAEARRQAQAESERKPAVTEEKTPMKMIGGW